MSRFSVSTCHCRATLWRPLARTLPLSLFACAYACAPARTDDRDAALADTLADRITAAYDFTAPDVVDRMASLYPDTGRVISASGGHVMTSIDSVRIGLAEFWRNVGTNMQNPVWQWDDVWAERLGDDAAVLTGTWSIAHIAPTGHPHTITGAWTAVFRRIDGEWKIVQEHLSVPPVTQ